MGVIPGALAGRAYARHEGIPLGGPSEVPAHRSMLSLPGMVRNFVSRPWSAITRTLAAMQLARSKPPRASPIERVDAESLRLRLRSGQSTVRVRIVSILEARGTADNH